MSYAEELWGHFYSMDSNADQFLDSTEMLEYLNKNKTDGKHGKKNNQLRFDINIGNINSVLLFSLP